MNTISPIELTKKMDAHRVMLIDVREADDYKAESIEGAYLLPFSSHISDDLVPKTDKAIVFFCQIGKRSAKVCELVLSQDPTRASYSLEGGINAWKQSGFATRNMHTSVISLDRQIRIAAGLFVFLGVMLGVFVHSAYYLVPGFVGAGLMFSGITNWCGLAKILLKMPWNKKKS
jgi:rhodanese-related sulfurtransferase